QPRQRGDHDATTDPLPPGTNPDRRPTSPGRPRCPGPRRKPAPRPTSTHARPPRPPAPSQGRTPRAHHAGRRQPMTGRPITRAYPYQSQPGMEITSMNASNATVTALAITPTGSLAGASAGPVTIRHLGFAPSIHPDAYVAPTAVLSGQVSVGAGSC